MESTISDVLDFRLLDEGALLMLPSPHRLGPFVDRVCRDCRGLVPTAVPLVYRVAPGDEVVSFDARRLTQILTAALQ
jgi:signal transduction histidine kinase